MINEKTNIEIFTEEAIHSGEEYLVTIEIHNIAADKLVSITVEPLVIWGREVGTYLEMDCEELSELERKKQRLIREIEFQVAYAYKILKENKKSRFRKALDKMTYKYENQFHNLYGFINDLGISIDNINDLPEVFKVDSINDLERLEKSILTNVSDLDKRIFKLRIEKLMEVLNKINEKEISNKNNVLKKGITLQPGAKLSFPFKIKSPYSLSEKTKEIQFKITYSNLEGEFYTMVKSKIKFLPSKSAVPIGAMIGSALGYFIKLFLIMSKSTNDMDLVTLISTIALGFIIGIVTSKYNNATKIVVKDFTGGIIIGTLAGLFSIEFLDKMKLLLK